MDYLRRGKTQTVHAGCHSWSAVLNVMEGIIETDQDFISAPKTRIYMSKKNTYHKRTDFSGAKRIEDEATQGHLKKQERLESNFHSPGKNENTYF